MSDPVQTSDSSVWLHPRRSPGTLYAGAALVLFVLIGLGVGSYVTDGHFVMAAVAGVVGLGLVGFLAVLAVGILVPGLELDHRGVRGRTGLGAAVDLPWQQIGIDVPDDGISGTFRFDFDGDELSINPRAWVGYRAAVLLVASTAAAADRLTPAARAELARLLGIGAPD